MQHVHPDPVHLALASFEYNFLVPFVNFKVFQVESVALAKICKKVIFIQVNDFMLFFVILFFSLSLW